MSITFQYTPKNLQCSHELHYRKFFPLKGRVLMIFGFLLIWAGLLLFLILGKEGNKFISGSLVVYGIIVIAFHFYLTKTMGMRTYKKLKNFHAPFNVEIDEEGIVLFIQDQPRQLLWSDVKKTVIANDMILLYATDLMFYVFPKENFKAGEFDQFESLVRMKVEKIF